MLDKAYEGSKDYQASSREWLSSSWEGFPSPKELATNILEHRKTGVELDTLRKIGVALSDTPEGFHVHKNLGRILKGRSKAVEEGKNIDYSTAEALAFGSLALEGNVVRVSGQDVERGTFSQRHAVLHDQESDERFTPLNHLSKDQAFLTICNSSLSEYGVLGFELGYSLVDPHLLTIWEAQCASQYAEAQLTRQSATLPTARRSSSTSSSPRASASGCSAPASSCPCRTATTAKGLSTRRPASSASCSCASTTRGRSDAAGATTTPTSTRRRRSSRVSTRTATCRSLFPLRPPASSTPCVARSTVTVRARV